MTTRTFSMVSVCTELEIRITKTIISKFCRVAFPTVICIFCKLESLQMLKYARFTASSINYRVQEKSKILKK